MDRIDELIGDTSVRATKISLRTYHENIQACIGESNVFCSADLLDQLGKLSQEVAEDEAHGNLFLLYIAYVMSCVQRTDKFETRQESWLGHVETVEGVREWRSKRCDTIAARIRSIMSYHANTLAGRYTHLPAKFCTLFDATIRKIQGDEQ